MRAQVLDQAAEGGRLQFRAGGVVHVSGVLYRFDLLRYVGVGIRNFQGQLNPSEPRDRLRDQEIDHLFQRFFGFGADDYDDFAQAIRIKLIKEINKAPMGDSRDRPPVYARGPWAYWHLSLIPERPTTG